MEEREMIRSIRTEIGMLLQNQKLSPCAFQCLSQTKDLLDILCFELELDVDE